MMKIVILNGSPQGSEGNCNEIARYVTTQFSQRAEFETIHLKHHDFDQTIKTLGAAQAHIYLTGTYWDSWGSPLQEFLEKATQHEGSEVFLGKPAGVFVLMHSVGGKGICSRLQGVLNTFGYLIPPMSGWVFSLVSQLASHNPSKEHAEDFWSFDDLNVIVENLIQYSNLHIRPEPWAFDKKEARRQWICPPVES